MPEDYGRRLPLDIRAVREIMRSPQMMQEQGGGTLLQSWGGPSQYVYWARQPLGKRMTYFAVQEGASTPSEIEVMTGLGQKEINRWLPILEKEGLVSVEEVTK